CLISVDDVLRLNEIGLELRSMARFQRFRAKSLRCLRQVRDTLHALDNLAREELEPATIRRHLQAIDAAYRRCVSLYRTCDLYARNAIFAAVSRFIPAEKLIDMIAPSDTGRAREAREWSTLVGRDFDEVAAWEHVKNHPWLVPNLFSRDAILITLRQKHCAS